MQVRETVAGSAVGMTVPVLLSKNIPTGRYRCTSKCKYTQIHRGTYINMQTRTTSTHTHTHAFTHMFIPTFQGTYTCACGQRPSDP